MAFEAQVDGIVFLLTAVELEDCAPFQMQAVIVFGVLDHLELAGVALKEPVFREQLVFPQLPVEPGTAPGIASDSLIEPGVLP